MKEHNIDQLFRQKLQNHAVKPTPAAWDQIASNLNTRRRKRGGYYAAAAAVVLLLSAGWFWLQQQPDPLQVQQTTVAVNKEAAAPGKTAPSQTPPAIVAAPDQAEAVSPENEQADADLPAAKNTTAAAAAAAPQLATTQTSKAPGKQNSPLKVQAETPTDRQDVQRQETVEQETALATALPIAPATENPLPQVQAEDFTLPSAETLLNSTEQVVIRYDASSAAQATADQSASDDEQEQGPEKVLSILQKVKQGEIGLADIRQAKDKFLSGRFNKP